MKALRPMVLIDSGKVIDVGRVQLWKAFSSMVLIDAGKVIDVNSEQLMKASSPMADNDGSFQEVLGYLLKPDPCCFCLFRFRHEVVFSI
jgi:hypothetical protein